MDLQKYTLDNLSTFHGRKSENLELWLVQIERAFLILKFSENADTKALEQSTIALHKLDGHAKMWFDTTYKATLPKWNDFKKALQDRFTAPNFVASIHDQLDSLRQGDSLVHYNNQFQTLCSQIHLEEHTQIHYYIKGLNSQYTRREVLAKQPTTLVHAMTLADTYEMASKQSSRRNDQQQQHQHRPQHQQRRSNSHSGSHHHSRSKHSHFNSHRSGSSQHQFQPQGESSRSDSQQPQQKHQQKQPFKSKPPCANCGRNNHETKDCWAPRKQQTISTLNSCNDNLLSYKGTLNGDIPVKILVDTGASVSLISLRFAEDKQLPLQPSSKHTEITYAQGEKHKSYFHLNSALAFGDYSGEWPLISCSLSNGHDIILGIDWIRQHQFTINDWETNSFTTRKHSNIHIELPNLSVINHISAKQLQDSEIFVVKPIPMEKEPLPQQGTPTPTNSSQLQQQTLNSLDYTRSEIQGDESTPPTTPQSQLEQQFIDNNTDIIVDEIPDFLPPFREHNHEIHLKADSIIPRQRPYRASYKELDELKLQLQQLLNKGLIEPSSTQYGAPVILVKQKTKTRMVINYKELNKATIPDSYPLPYIQDLFERLHSAKVYSKIDLASGYHQIRVQPEDVDKTAFTTRYGTFNFLVMPFGLTNAPATFQRNMNNIFQDLLDTYIIVYLDDLLVFSQDIEQHKQHLNTVLERLRQHQFYAKKSKCEFFRSKIDFLGHTISQGYISTQQEKIAALHNWPMPTTLKSLQRFLGFTNYYRKFVKNYAHITAPLYNICSSKVKFKWEQQHTTAFQEIIAALESATALKLPDPHKPFTIHSDASDKCIGAVLQQEDTPIQFLSRKLSDTEQRYSTREKELLAIVYALHKFRPYILGSPITVYTDHKSLEQTLTTEHSNYRLARWTELMAEYQVQIKYIEGSTNIVADALSRQLNATSVSSFSPDLSELKTATANDNTIAHFKQQLTAKDGLYYNKSNKLYVPPPLRQQILQQMHDSDTAGHLSAPKTISKIELNYYWPTLRHDTFKHVKECFMCQRNKIYRGKKQGLLYPHDVPTDKWKTITLDFMTHLPESQGYDAILVVIDKLTKRHRIFPTRSDCTAQDIAQLMLDNIIKIHGIPTKIISDRDSKFTSTVWKTLFSLLGSTLNFSTSYHPETDGQTERSNQTIQQMLRNTINHSQDNWAQHLAYIEMAINSAPHSATKQTPYYLDTGTQLNMDPRATALQQASNKTAEDMVQTMQEIMAVARKNLLAAQQSMAEQANKKRKYIEYQQGQLVLLNSKNLPLPSLSASAKLRPLYIGPFTIMEKISPVVYSLALPDNYKIHNVFHISLLKQFHGTPPEAPQPDIIEGEPEYEVEAIIGHRTQRKKKQFLIKWKGYGHEYNTWEPEQHLEHAQEALNDYYKQQTAKAAAATGNK